MYFLGIVLLSFLCMCNFGYSNNINIKNYPKTVIKYDVKQMKPKIKKTIKKVNAITYFTFGEGKEPFIEIYISPSCIHCAQFLSENLEEFVQKHNNECLIKVILLPVEAKDFFIMKLIQAESKNTCDYYRIFSNYMKRVVACIGNIKNPTEEQKQLYKGYNTNSNMIKYQLIAKDFGFSDEKIISAIPNMDEDYELAIVEYYKSTVQEIFEKLQLDTKNNVELDVPLIIYNGKMYKTINKAFAKQKEQNNKMQKT